VIGVVRLVPKVDPVWPMRRTWVLFFSDGDRGHWWSRFFRPGFRHIRAMAWFDDAQRWVYFDPTGKGLHLEILTDEAAGPRWEHLVITSTAILRARSEFGRAWFPAVFCCVGAVKALLGIRSCALGPYGLYRHLVARGAEIVERPSEERLDVESPISAPENGRRAAAGG